jgi:hypothetical protein
MNKKRVAQVIAAGAIGFVCLTAESAGCTVGTPGPAKTTDAPADVPAKDRVYQCNDGQIITGRERVLAYQKDHPNVICKRIK